MGHFGDNFSTKIYLTYIACSDIALRVNLTHDRLYDTKAVSQESPFSQHSYELLLVDVLEIGAEICYETLNYQ